MTDLERRLPRHARLLKALRRAVNASDHWRWLDLSCSLGRGGGDELSDADTGIGYDVATPRVLLDEISEQMVRELGPTVEVLRHHLDGWPDDTWRIAAQYLDGTQLDLVFMPSTRSVGLHDAAVALVDKDNRLAAGWTPPSALPPSPAEAREWVVLGWWRSPIPPSTCIAGLCSRLSNELPRSVNRWSALGIARWVYLNLGH